MIFAPTPSGNLAMNNKSKEIQSILEAPFDPRLIKWKPQSIKGNKCLAVAYIDARRVQERLDQAFGPMGWESTFELLPNGSVVCTILATIDGEKWTRKSDVGSQSAQPDDGDRMKAAFSDALKRAAVNWGIGRYLYKIPCQWVDYDPIKKRVLTPPRLPDFAIPKVKADDVFEDEEEPEEEPQPQPQAQKQPQPASKQANPQQQIQQPQNQPQQPQKPNLPKNGAEVLERARKYEREHGLECSELQAHLDRRRHAAGFTQLISEVTDEKELKQLVDWVREFDRMQADPVKHSDSPYDRAIGLMNALGLKWSDFAREIPTILNNPDLSGSIGGAGIGALASDEIAVIITELERRLTDKKTRKPAARKEGKK